MSDIFYDGTVSGFFYGGWIDLVRVVLVGTAAYAGLVLVLRTSGKRTLSKMNAFDLVVTVALGSTLATILLSKDVALAEGLVAYTLLVVLQFVVTWTSVRVGVVRSLVKSEPTLLVRDGQVLAGRMASERVTEAELRAAARSAGFASLDEIAAVVLETDGSFSVIPRTAAGDPTAMSGVSMP